MMKGGGHGVVLSCPCQRWRKAARMRMQVQCCEGLASAFRLGDGMAELCAMGVREVGMSGWRGRRWTAVVLCRGGLCGEAAGSPA